MRKFWIQSALYCEYSQIWLSRSFWTTLYIRSATINKLRLCGPLYFLVVRIRFPKTYICIWVQKVVIQICWVLSNAFWLENGHSKWLKYENKIAKVSLFRQFCYVFKTPFGEPLPVEYNLCQTSIIAVHLFKK